MSIAQVREALQAVDVGAAQTFRNLALLPLIGRQPRQPRYITLEEGLRDGTVQISEVSEQGRVPELAVINSGELPVLLLDGEELLGAKQNRVLNLTILVAAHSSLVVPVSCVEAGRWRHVSREFSAAPRTQFATGRAARMRQVTDSIASSGTRRSDQSEVWSSIDAKAARLGAASDTMAMSAVFERHALDVDAFAAGFEPVPGQTGAIFAINGAVVGLEHFDAPDTWSKLAPKLVRGYAVDAIDGMTPPDSPLSETVAAFLAHVRAAHPVAYPAVGMGEDVRLRGELVNGAALVADGGVVHMSAFAATVAPL